MRLILHDLNPEQAAELLPAETAACRHFAASPAVAHCLGCFGCWLKTPGQCLIADRGQQFLPLLAQATELCVVSRCVYGGLSPDNKAVLERSIGYLLPFFQIQEGEMHHQHRYDKPLLLSYHFYGTQITAEERETAQNLLAANALNLGAQAGKPAFYTEAQALKEALA